MQAAKERVLLVDDEPQILTALEDLLGDDYTVFKSESPERALDLVRQESDIAVVITDQRMPHMNGDEFLRKLGDENHALRIMVSGYADLPAVLRAVNDGKVYAYVTKPWDEADLLHKVQTAAEHFRLTQELEYERRLLRDLMENSPDGIYFKDADLRFLRANSSFARTLGVVNPRDLVGRRLSEIQSASEEAEAVEMEDRRVLRERKPHLDGVRQYQRAGRGYFLSETKAPIRSKSGIALGIVGISRDVTERVTTSEALRESEAVLQQQTRILNSILDGMGDGVVVTTSDGRTLLFNKEANRLLGVTARDVPAEDWPRAYGLYLNDNVTLLPVEQNPLCRAMTGEALVQLELSVKNAVVAGAIVAVTATPLRDPSGTVTGAIALLRDVTQQRNLEQQLAQSQKMEAIGQLAGGVAHDFNNLLTVIVGCGELALEDFDPADSRRINVVEVLAAARHATLLTQQLLAFSRRQVVQRTPLQLNDIVAGMNSLLCRLIGSHIELLTVLRPDLSLVTADQSQLEQVVLNLVVNARDAMADGGLLRVETDELVLSDAAAVDWGAPPGRFVALTVTDTGSGMSEETRKRLFEPFFTTKELGKGTGLGLSTVYGIVRQSGGFIRVNSAPGQGTEFRILLPGNTGSGRTLPSVPPAAGARAVLGNVLLIDSNEAVRTITARMLRSEGHIVIEAATLTDARARLAENEHIDLVLTDLGLAGAAFSLEVSAVSSELRVLYMTGGGPVMKESPSSGYSALPLSDENGLLAKPFSRSQLLKKVQELLRERDREPDAR
ncbi:MAG: PAS domain-containing protein [Polyangiaceae bacterium]